MVSRLQFGNLTIEFQPQSKQEAQVEQSVPMEIIVERPSEEESLEVKGRRQKQEYEDLLEEARLANPGLYEDLIQLEGDDAGDRT